MLIKTYVEIDPRVKPLIMTVKHWAKSRKLNDAVKGGTLSSYCWVMMTLNFLQTRTPPILPSLQEIYSSQLKSNPDSVQPTIVDGVDCSFYEDLESLQTFGNKNFESLGSLLHGFFRHYAYEFDYTTQVVSVKHGSLLTKNEKGWDKDVERLYRFLCVEEPFNNQRNLSNSADAISVIGIRNEFRRAANLLASTGDLNIVCEEYIFNSNFNSYYYNHHGNVGNFYARTQWKKFGNQDHYFSRHNDGRRPYSSTFFQTYPPEQHTEFRSKENFKDMNNENLGAYVYYNNLPKLQSYQISPFPVGSDIKSEKTIKPRSLNQDAKNNNSKKFSNFTPQFNPSIHNIYWNLKNINTQQLPHEDNQYSRLQDNLLNHHYVGGDLSTTTNRNFNGSLYKKRITNYNRNYEISKTKDDFNVGDTTIREYTGNGYGYSTISSNSNRKDEHQRLNQQHKVQPKVKPLLQQQRPQPQIISTQPGADLINIKNIDENKISSTDNKYNLIELSKDDQNLKHSINAALNSNGNFFLTNNGNAKLEKKRTSTKGMLLWANRSQRHSPANNPELESVQTMFQGLFNLKKSEQKNNCSSTKKTKSHLKNGSISNVNFINDVKNPKHTSNKNSNNAVNDSKKNKEDKFNQQNDKNSKNTNNHENNFNTDFNNKKFTDNSKNLPKNSTINSFFVQPLNRSRSNSLPSVFSNNSLMNSNSLWAKEEYQQVARPSSAMMIKNEHMINNDLLCEESNSSDDDENYVINNHAEVIEENKTAVSISEEAALVSSEQDSDRIVSVAPPPMSYRDAAALEREIVENQAELYSLVLAIEHLEKAYIRASVTPKEYTEQCLHLISQFKTISQLLNVENLPLFLSSLNSTPLAALKRLQIGVPATFEHKTEVNKNSAKHVAETVQVFITLMDSLKLNLIAVDQIHPLLSDLILSLNKVDTLDGKYDEEKEKIKNWLIELNKMKASEELDDDQVRQLLFDLERIYGTSAHTEFHRQLDI
ncbi:hypothetical protein HK099_008507 [Clydaea vesicula]|uniref:Uncharacterized protein n=1 Tax=Clydaea vesicula TaxID=447962 RepID=A0AAD5U4P2_9FUNG|nr:hypothetical protein HK099_008507 [Clydaea vesicula]